MNFVNILVYVVIFFVVLIVGIGASLMVWRNVIYCLILDVLKELVNWYMSRYSDKLYYDIKGAFKAAIKEVYRENNNNDR